MADKLQFQEKLSGILNLAKDQDMRLMKKDIEKYFKEEALTEQQMELVCDYLLSQKVVVKGYVKKGGTVTAAEEKEQVLSEEEKAYLTGYMNELEGIEPAAQDEKVHLFERAAAGDSMARGRLIELYLSRVAELAREMKHPDVFIGDMIQEGNVSLMLALDNLTSAGEAEMEIEAELRAGMQALIAEHTDIIRRDNSVVKKVRDLDERIIELTESLGRKVTIDELVLYAGLTEEEIRDIMKLTDSGDGQE